MEPISRIDPDNGILYYRGISVSELIVSMNFESVLFLLLHGRRANSCELKEIENQLLESRQHFMEPLDALLKDREEFGLSLLVLLAESLDDVQKDHELDDYETLLTMVSCTPLAFAYDYHLDQGNEPVHPRENFKHSENLLWMLTGREPKHGDTEDFETCLILHMDDPDNPSLSALERSFKTSQSITAAITSALSKHSGPLHHGAGLEAALMLDELWLSANLQEGIETRLDSDRKLYGLGHRIYRTIDPRARILREMLRRRHKIGSKYIEFIDKVAKEGARQLNQRKEIIVHPNVDLFNAVTYGTFGIAPSLNTELFAVSRSAGWMAHALEHIQH